MDFLPQPNNILFSSATNVTNDSTLTRNNFPVTSGHIAEDIQAAQSFSNLLARQISEANSATPAPTIVIDDNVTNQAADPAESDTQYPVTTDDSPSANSTNMMTAILLQIPVHLQNSPLKSIPVGQSRECFEVTGNVPVSLANPAAQAVQNRVTATANPATPDANILAEISAGQSVMTARGSLLENHGVPSLTENNAEIDLTAVPGKTANLMIATLLQTSAHLQNSPIKNTPVDPPRERSEAAENVPVNLANQAAQTVQNRATATANPATLDASILAEISARQPVITVREALTENNSGLPITENNAAIDPTAVLEMMTNQPQKNNSWQSSGDPAKMDSNVITTAHDPQTAVNNPAPPSISNVPENKAAAASPTNPSPVNPNNIQVITSAQPGVVPFVLSTQPLVATDPQTIFARLNSRGWTEELSQKITWVSTQKNQTAELHLNPPDLGALNVVLKISDNQLTAQFVSPHSAVRDAVENSLPKLREILADNNIMLGNATVSDQPPRERSAWEFTNQNPDTKEQRKVFTNRIEPDKTLLTATSIIPRHQHSGILDTFA